MATGNRPIQRDAPPSYETATEQHNRPAIETNHTPVPEVNFDNISPTAGHIYEVAQTSRGGLEVKLGERNVYHIGSYDVRDKANVIIYGGYDSTAPQLGLANFTHERKDFDIYLGGQRNPASHEWNVVRCASDGKMFHSDYYRFEVPIKHEGRTTKKKYEWKKTHESKFGSSKFSTRDFKLIDEDSDDVVAVYISGIGRHAKVEIYRNLGEQVETTALLVLFAINERYTRYMKGVARTFPNAGV